jgi:hypothetical protein
MAAASFRATKVGVHNIEVEECGAMDDDDHEEENTNAVLLVVIVIHNATFLDLTLSRKEDEATTTVECASDPRHTRCAPSRHRGCAIILPTNDPVQACSASSA